MSKYIYQVADKPLSAIKVVPEWWKSIPKYADTDKVPHPVATVKACAPTIDAFNLGYTVKLWADVYVKDVEGRKEVSWMDMPHRLLGEWEAVQLSHFEIPKGFAKQVFKYQHGWITTTPKGWSCLFVHPFGHNNLPIQTIPGLVDTDILTTDINTPFMIREDFTGIIPKGTPMFQVIPIKREPWNSKVIGGDEYELDTQQKRLMTKLWGYYSSRRERKIYKQQKAPSR